MLHAAPYDARYAGPYRGIVCICYCKNVLHATLHAALCAALYAVLYTLLYAALYALLYDVMYAVLYAVLYALLYALLYDVMYAALYAVLCDVLYDVTYAVHYTDCVRYRVLDGQRAVICVAGVALQVAVTMQHILLGVDPALACNVTLAVAHARPAPILFLDAS